VSIRRWVARAIPAAPENTDSRVAALFASPFPSHEGTTSKVFRTFA